MEQRTTNDIVNKLATKNTDMKGRRCVMAGDAVDPQDYVTLNDLETAVDLLSKQGLRVTPFPAKPNQFLNSVNSSGVFTAKQPAFADISGTIAEAQLPIYALPPISDFSPIIQNGGVGSRALNTIYQNTFQRVLYVSISLTFSPAAGAGSQTAIKIGPDTGLAYTITRFGLNSSASTTVELPVTFLVPINWYYEALQIVGPCSIDQWCEWY